MALPIASGGLTRTDDDTAMDPRLDAMRRALESAVDGLSREELAWHLPGKWSAAEVLEHLYLTYTGTTKGMERVLAHGAPLATRPSLRQRALAFAIVRAGYVPTGLEAPRIARPKGLPGEQVRSEFEVRLAAMDAAITACEARFGRRVKVLDHPILGPLTAPQWRTLHVVHGEHHRRQLLRLRERALASR